MLGALARGDGADFAQHLREYLKWGSSARDAEILGFSERSLRRLSEPDSDPRLSVVLRILRDLNERAGSPGMRQTHSGQIWPEREIR